MIKPTPNLFEESGLKAEYVFFFLFMWLLLVDYVKYRGIAFLQRILPFSRC